MNRLIHAVCLLTSTCLLAREVLTSILLTQGLDPGFLFLLLAPPKLFHATGSLPKTYLSQSAWHITLLAIVGVGAGAVMTAVIMKYVFPYGWSWPQSFMFGAIVAATDPVAAVSLLKQVCICYITANSICRTFRRFVWSAVSAVVCTSDQQIAQSLRSNDEGCHCSNACVYENGMSRIHVDNLNSWKLASKLQYLLSVLEHAYSWGKDKTTLGLLTASYFGSLEFAQSRLIRARVTFQALSHIQVHASEELTTVIDGEPLVDDGIAAVLYAIFLVRLLHHVVTHCLCCYAIVHACRHVMYK